MDGRLALWRLLLCFFTCHIGALAVSPIGLLESASMAGKGRKFVFHGSFKKKREAVKEERKVGGFILKRKIENHLRYLVLTERKR
jgi:hypothetical protein